MKPPASATLAKYGLSADEWLGILESQGGACAVCRKIPNGRLCVDHAHVPRWRKLKPAQRKVHVRGLLCWFCNHHYVGRSITIAKSEAVTAYLRAHEDRIVRHVLEGRAA